MDRVEGTMDGKVVVVTGAASGIGRALARRFLADGARVAVADIDKDALAAAAVELAGEHHDGDERVLAVPTDVGRADEVEALAEATVERFGAVHVVCNNAGIGVSGWAWEVPADRWRAIVDVNLLGVAHGVRAFVPRMIEQGEGHVVNTASAAGLVTGPGMAPYYATKHGVVALSEALYFDLQLSGAPVGVSVVCPEWVRTDIFTHGGEAASPAGAYFRDLIVGQVATGLDPANVADAVAEAIRTGRFWVLTHDSTLPMAQTRWDAIAAGGTPVLPQVPTDG
jgi:NAD(P)-dependent dehydrogenase (short-subunit alcohol dehydrogenase family)